MRGARSLVKVDYIYLYDEIAAEPRRDDALTSIEAYRPTF